MASRDISRRDLAITYLELRARQKARAFPARARILTQRIAYQDYDSLVGFFEEIYLRRHYPFAPTRPEPFVIDCGANIGLATLFFKSIAPDASVLAIEPDPDAFRLLQANTALLDDVETACWAAGSSSGTATLSIPAVRYAGGASTALRLGSVEREIEIETKPLSSQVSRPVDFLKVDAEGSEGAILGELARSGALAQVAEAAIEYHAGGSSTLSELLDLLETEGFRVRIASAGDAVWNDDQTLILHARR